MRIQILGSAAGGGFPQWNCNCYNCKSFRSRTFNGSIRSQTQVAVSHDGGAWFLVNASPDLRTQIEATAVLHPRNTGRHSPIHSVLLTGGDIDQIAGLLSLRELQTYRIYCTPSIRRILQEDNSMLAMLNRVPNQVTWTEVSSQGEFSLLTLGGQNSGICCETFSLSGHYPAYVSAERKASLSQDEAQMGLIVASSAGQRFAYLPAVGAIDDSMLQRLEQADVLLFDGTFWSDDELIRVQGGGSTAREMGHIPVSGDDGSLRKLADLQRPRKIFVHVNNTNPMLDESGPEYREVRAAGWEVAQDGWHIDL